MRELRLAVACCFAGSFLLHLSFAQEPPAAESVVPLAGWQQIERRVNTFLGNRQQDPVVAAAENGDLLVAWSSRRQELGTFGVFAQLLDPLGRPLGTEIRVNQHAPGHQMKPAAVFAADGSAWLVWNSIGQDGDGGGIYGRRFVLAEDEEGRRTLQPAGDEFAVSQTRFGDQFDAVIEADDRGGVLVAWVSAGIEGERVHARRFTAHGAPQGDELTLSEGSRRWERLPVLAPLSDGRFAAAWAECDADGLPQGILARVITPEGLAGPAFRVPQDEDFHHVEPSLASDGSERFVVAWMSTDGGMGWTPWMRRFTADGTAAGDATAVHVGGDGSRSGATAVMHPDGRFAVLCSVTGEKTFREGPGADRPTDIRARLFHSDGSPIGACFQVNRFDLGEQGLQVGINGRHAVWTRHDQLAVAWHGNIEDDGRAVGLTLLAPESLQPEAPPVVEPLAAGLDLTSEEVYPADGEVAKPEWDPNFVPEPWSPPLPPRGGSGGFRAFTQTGWVPPDPDLAVGPNHIVVVVNQSIKWFTKDGVELYSDTLGANGFFGSVGAQNFVFDPIALYDHQSQRYVVAAAEHSTSGGDLVDIAVSDDDDPNGTWHKYRFDFSSFCDFIDFPNLGVGADAVYMAADCFGGQGNWVHIFPKAELLAGLPFTPTSVQTSPSLRSLGCIKSYDANESTQYFASAGGGFTLRFNAITDSLGTPQLHTKTVSVKKFNGPPDADQLGTSNKADTVDARIKNGVYRNGRLWLAHTVGAGGQQQTARVRWYEFDMMGWPANPLATPVEIQSGTLNYGPYEHNWFPDIHVDDAGNAAISYNHSSPNDYIGIECVTRLASDPLGTMGPRGELQRSTSPETGSRWGDYSGLEEDPVVPGTFWSHTEYRTSSWRTWVGEFFTVKNPILSQTVLIAGFPVHFTVENAEPGEIVTYLYSLTGSGTGPCVPQLGGLCLDILQPITITGTAVADATGIAELVVTVPPNAPPITVSSQAVIQRGAGGVDSVKSNTTEADIL